MSRCFICLEERNGSFVPQISCKWGCPNSSGRIGTSGEARRLNRAAGIDGASHAAQKGNRVTRRTRHGATPSGQAKAQEHAARPRANRGPQEGGKAPSCRRLISLSLFQRTQAARIVLAGTNPRVMHFFVVRQPEGTWSAEAILCGRRPHFLASQGKRRTLTLQLRWSGKRLITYPGLMRLYLRATEVRSLRMSSPLAVELPRPR